MKKILIACIVVVTLLLPNQIFAGGVWGAPYFINQPQSVNALLGAYANFYVYAESDDQQETMFYQWQKNGVNIQGAVYDYYEIYSVSANDTGAYRCIAYNVYGSDTSNVAYLRIVTLSTELIAYYKFTGNTADSSSKGNHLTNVGASLTTDRVGTSNRAYSFNGTSNYMKTGPNASLRPSKQEMAVSLYVYPQDSDMVILSNYDFTNDYGYFIGIDSMYQVYAIINGEYFNTWTTVPPNEWSHIILNIKMQDMEGMLTPEAVIYINGQPDAWYNFYPSITYALDTLLIGGVPTISKYYTGKLDEIRIYDRSLLEEEILQLYQPLVPIIQNKSDFSYQINLCAGDYTDLTVQASGVDTLIYKWYKNGSLILSSTSNKLKFKPVAVADTGTYRCIVSNAYGYDSTDYFLVVVNPKPTVSFTVDYQTQCFNGHSFNFTGNTTGFDYADYYVDWNYASSANDLYNVYLTEFMPSFTVQRIAYTMDGCSDTFSMELYLADPQIDFTIDQSSNLCDKNSLVKFNNLSITSSGTLTYLWRFGDGATSTQTNPQHSYTAAGNYMVTLIAYSSLGCTDSLTNWITIYESPTAYFTTYDSAQCLNDNFFEFYDQSFSYYGIQRNEWHFGDGQVTEGPSAYHGYSFDSTFRVTLYTFDYTGCYDSFYRYVVVHPEPVADFSVNAYKQCLTGNSFNFTNNSTIKSGTMTYFWQFGDGDSSNSTNPVKSYGSSNQFYAELYATSDKGCTDHTGQIIEVLAMPQADFYVEQDSQCLNNNSFKFKNTSNVAAGNLYYNWNFGNGNTSYQKDPTVAYMNDTTYSVSLVAFSDEFCYDTIVKNITVLPMPKASFTVNKHSQCLSNNSFIFTNTSTIKSGSLVYEWNFGDGNTSVAANPTHSYSMAGEYYVKLRTYSNTFPFCSDSFTYFVVVNPEPVANFDIDSSTNCLNSNYISFKNKSTITNGTLTYNWNFGDGSISTFSNPSYMYGISGNYNVILIAKSFTGCSDTITKNLTVHPSPKASFTVSNSGVCADNNGFTFTNTSNISSGTLSYFWDFGDNNNSTSTSPTHSYSNAGAYQVKLIATSNNGCQDSFTHIIYVYPTPNAMFSINDSDQCLNTNTIVISNQSTVANGSLLYNWKFGDGVSGSYKNPVYSYQTAGTYNIKLITTSTYGCIDSFESPVTIYPQPKASFTVNTTASCLNDNAFSFTNTSTVSSGTLSYLWNLGDQSISTNTNHIRTYVSPGSYHVKLIATSNNGCVDSTTLPVTVYPMPVAGVGVNGNSQCLDDNNFKFVSNSTIPFGSLTYNWDFGDGKNAFVKDPVHVYNQDTTYSVRLIVTSNEGCKDTIVVGIEVNPVPTADFQVNNASQCLTGNNLVLTNTSTIKGGGLSTLDHSWNFGDNNTSTSIHPSHSYNSSDKFYVSLAITSDKGCKDSINTLVAIHPNPSPSFTVNQSSQCLDGNLFKFTDKTNFPDGNLNYSWDFGDGTTSFSKDPSHVYTKDSTFTVELTATSIYQCSGTTSQAVGTYPEPVADFDIDIPAQCYLGNQFTFTDASTIKSGSKTLEYKFGDGDFSTATNPVKSYSSAGSFFVWQIVTSNNGCKDSIQKTVTLQPSPNVNFDIDDNEQCLVNNLFGFTNKSSINTGSLTYEWQFGDNNGNNMTHTTHSYGSVGTFDVKLIATSDLNCKDSLVKAITINDMPVPDFTFADSLQCEGANNFKFYASSTIPTGTLTHEWEPETGNIISGDSLYHTFNQGGVFDVKLTAISDKGCSASTTKKAYVQQAPSSEFSINPPQTDSIVYITYLGNADADAVFTWDFGGAYIMNGSGKGPYTVKWIQSGIKTISLSIFDGVCSSVLTQKTVSVFGDYIVLSSAGDTSICQGDSTYLYASYKPNYKYMWYRDGKELTGHKMPFMSTKTQGSYQVKVTDSVTGAFKYTNKVFVKVNTTDFSLGLYSTSTYLQTPPFFTSFVNTTPYPNEYDFTWYLGDGTVKYTRNVTNHQYMNPGKYDIMLYAVNKTTGCVDSLIRPNYIICEGETHPCNYKVSIIPQGTVSICEGDSFRFEAGTTTGYQFRWLKNGVVISGEENPYIYAKENGEYRVVMIKVQGTDSCANQSNPSYLSYHPVVKPIILADGEIQPCSYDSVRLYTPYFYEKYQWSNGDSTQSTYAFTSGDFYLSVQDIRGCKAISDVYKVNASTWPTPEICMVTVDSNSGTNMIIWEKPKSSAIDSYYIYKESTVANKYIKIGALGYNQLSVFVDTNSNPLIRADRYRISLIDTCGIESALSVPHKTIHLTASKGTSGENNLAWNHYSGFSYNTYKIYRGTKPSNLTLIDSIQSGLNSYSDLNPPAGLVFYRIALVRNEWCAPAVYRAISTPSGPFSQSMSNIKDYSITGTQYLLSEFDTVFLDSKSGASKRMFIFTNAPSWNATSEVSWLNVLIDNDTKEIEITTNEQNNSTDRMGTIKLSASGIPDHFVTVIQSGTSGIADGISQALISIYPNPAKDVVNIDIELLRHNQVQVEMFNMLGEKVNTDDIYNLPEGKSHIQLRTYHLPKGIYMLKVTMANQSQVYRIMKN